VNTNLGEKWKRRATMRQNEGEECNEKWRRKKRRMFNKMRKEE
jgi:hypothetical protein